MRCYGYLQFNIPCGLVYHRLVKLTQEQCLSCTVFFKFKQQNLTYTCRGNGCFVGHGVREEYRYQSWIREGLINIQRFILLSKFGTDPLHQMYLLNTFSRCFSEQQTMQAAQNRIEHKVIPALIAFTASDVNFTLAT